MLGDPPTPAALAAGSPPLPVLTTILPPAPWLFTLTPSHWFSLLSRCRSTGGDGQRQPLPGPLGLGNQGVAPLQTEHPPSCTAHLLRRWAPASSRRARGSAGRRRAPRSGWHLGWAAPALGGPPPAACHGKEPPRQGTGPPPPRAPAVHKRVRAMLGLHRRAARFAHPVSTPGTHREHPCPHAAVPTPPHRFHAVGRAGAVHCPAGCQPAQPSSCSPGAAVRRPQPQLGARVGGGQGTGGDAHPDPPTPAHSLPRPPWCSRVGGTLTPTQTPTLRSPPQGSQGDGACSSVG